MIAEILFAYVSTIRARVKILTLARHISILLILNLIITAAV